MNLIGSQKVNQIIGLKGQDYLSSDKLESRLRDFVGVEPYGCVEGSHRVWSEQEVFKNKEKFIKINNDVIQGLIARSKSNKPKDYKNCNNADIIAAIEGLVKDSTELICHQIDGLNAVDPDDASYIKGRKDMRADIVKHLVAMHKASGNSSYMYASRTVANLQLKNEESGKR